MVLNISPVAKKLTVLATVLVVAAAVLPAGTAAAAAGGIGCVDFGLLISSHPDTAAAEQTTKAAYEEAKSEFEAKAAGMSEQDRRNLAIQLQQQFDAKMNAALDPIRAKVLAAIKAVADGKGLAVVIDKSVPFYGGEDITAEVGRKMAGQ